MSSGGGLEFRWKSKAAGRSPHGSVLADERHPIPSNDYLVAFQNMFRIFDIWSSLIMGIEDQEQVEKGFILRDCDKTSL